MVTTRSKSKQKLEITKKKVHEKTRQCKVYIIRLSPQEIEHYKNPVTVSSNLQQSKTKIKPNNENSHGPSTSYNLRKMLDTQSEKEAAPASKVKTSKTSTKVNTQCQSPKMNKGSGNLAPSTSYDLRKKTNSALVSTVAPKRKPSKAIVKVSSPCPKALWMKLKNSRAGIPTINAVIISKMRTHSPWPSKLVKINGKQALVYFFGTGEHGEVKLDEIILFEDGLYLLKLYALKKIPGYRRAVREAEVFLSIPSNKSILNNLF